MCRTKLAASISAVTCVLVLSGTAGAGDWPQYRFNAERAAAAPDPLPPELELQWVRDLPEPDPAFPNEVRLAYDLSYEPVVLGKRMFVPSMVTDSVTALDTGTGHELWTFFTGGPVRFAPAAGDGRLYVTSDDGYLYCLDAAQGSLLWKFRGLPEDRQERKVLGNGRLISLFPARTGPVLDEGIVYFAAGLWPADGVFIHALDAESGEAVWSNTTSHQIESANVDHGISQVAGLTPQGYLARVHEKLVVPCGAQLPAFLDPQTGEVDTYTMGWGGRNGLPKGCWFVAGAGKYLSHGGDLYDVTRSSIEQDHREVTRYMTTEMTRLMYPGGRQRLLIDPANQRELGNFRRPVITEDVLYYNDVENKTGITAYDLTDVTIEERSGSKPSRFRASDRYPDRWQGVFKRLWNLPSKLDVHIKAGNRLYAGGTGSDGKGIVQAIDVPETGGEANVSWKTSIDGTPHSMLAADGKLFITTREGQIFAFGGKAAEVARHARPEVHAPADDEWTRTAGDLLETADVQEGYALVLGIDSGRLVEELAARPSWQVIAVDPDEDKVRQVRERLSRSGLYGRQATVLTGDPLKFPFPPFLANLVVTEDPASLETWWTRANVGGLFHSLRPYGGTACLPMPEERAGTVLSVLRRADLSRARVRQSGRYVLLSREGALEEAAGWSHAGGDSANSAASQDRFVKPPLNLLWFDSSFRWHRKPGSAEVRVAGGRVFVKTDELKAIDAFTGRHSWTIPLADDVADASAQMVAVQDGVYLAAGTEPCLVLDPATGERAGTIELPGGSGPWENLRIRDEFLIATSGSDLFCLNRRTGELAWTFTCGRSGLSAAVGGGKVFCSELLNPRRDGKVGAEDAGTMMRAFDIASGKLLWEVPCGHPIHYGEEMDWILTTEDMYDGRDGTRMREGVASPQIAGTRLISGSKDSFTLFNLASADRDGSQLEWNRRGCTDMRAAPHLVTTRYKANAAYVDLETLDITPLWNIRPGCGNANNLIPADGLLNVPNVTGGCECNYTPVSKAFAPESVIVRTSGD